ncbi:hypothetical protein THAOC_32844 [Thalassiosira oceanica]|uniref:Nucleotide-diphospho-sugar transferase domain-containing protein n=1 Tax=Thalassiosira oceanica TaxID=159749 RepID=K0R8A4_THAOC|nr:hypothetical protein THAOC_32844 [Thalassiosira oceanica]|eukprot:EJK48369.1 hypothetical protein THAOC_32844 [Thalassiosira oceanica]
MNSSTSRLPLLRRISLLFSLATLSFYVGFHSTPPATNDRDLIDLQQLLHRCGSQDALLLFQSSEACPGDKCPDAEMSPPLIANVTDALENCDTLNVQWTHNPTPTTLCQVYIPQDGLPTYHVSRWLRLAAEGPLDRSKNLRHVAVMTNPRGINRHNVPRMQLIRKHWQSLLIFLEHLDDVLDDVRKIIDERLAKLTAISNRHQPIIAMTVNKGQSQLLANFLCAARSKNLDVSRILVFVTDAESEAIVRNLISDDHSSPMVYFDRYNFESVPLGGDNETYGDATFTAMMWVKILSVLYISLLGHDIMFQVWGEIAFFMARISLTRCAQGRGHCLGR